MQLSLENRPGILLRIPRGLYNRRPETRYEYLKNSLRASSKTHCAGGLAKHAARSPKNKLLGLSETRGEEPLNTLLCPLKHDAGPWANTTGIP